MIGATFKILLLIFVSLLVQGAFPETWVRPDCVLLWLVPWAMRFGRSYGALVGFMSGIMLGIVGAVPCGLSAIAYGVLGYVIGWWGEHEIPGIFVELLGVALATVMLELFFVGVTRISPWAVVPGVSVMRRWLWQCLVLNVLLLWPVRSILHRLVCRVTFSPVGWHS